MTSPAQQLPPNVTALVAATVRATTRSATRRRTYAAHLTSFAQWSYDRGWRPGTHPLLDLNQIERYVAVGMRGAKDSTRASRRAILRRMARNLSPDAQDLPDREQIPYRRVPPPYLDEQIAGYLRCVAAQPTVGRRRAMSAILYLGLGCGFDTRDLGYVRGCDLAADVSGVHATVVAGARPRTVTSLARFEDGVRALISEEPDRLLIGGRLGPRNNLTGPPLSQMIIDGSLPKLVVGRLRSTWLLEHMERRTPLPILMAAAGLKTVRPLEDLLEFATPVDDADRSRWLRGDLE